MKKIGKICQYTGIEITMQTIIWIIFIIGLIFVPIIVSLNYSQQWTPLAQTLFQIGLCSISIWFGVVQSKHISNSKWLEAAASACRTLFTIRNQLNRLELSQKNSCDEVTSLFPDHTNELEPIKISIRHSCDASISIMKNSTESIDDTIAFLIRFIKGTCDKYECSEILEYLDDCCQKHEEKKAE